MRTIGERINELAINEGLSIRKLEMNIGCSNGVLSKSVKKGTDISSLWLSKIIEIYSKYSAEWILLERGSMMKIENYQIDKNGGVQIVAEKREDYATIELDEKTELIVLRSENKLLREMVNSKDKNIDFLSEMLRKK